MTKTGGEGAPPTGAGPSVDVVVVTYQSASHIEACLRSVLGSDYDGPTRVVVVDNASADDGIDRAVRVDAGITCVRNDENRGFAAACNQGIRAGAGDLVLLLNPDARLQPGTLSRLVRHLEEHPEVAIVGPALEAPDGSLQRDVSATGIFPSFRQSLFEYTRLGRMFPDSPWVRSYFMPGFDRRSNRRVAMVQGACFLFPRAVLERIGLLDEGFFLYFEETDFCKRACDAGWQVHYLGETAVVHVGSHGSADGRPSTHHFIRSLYRFHRKHYGRLEATALWAVLMPYHGLRTLRLGLLALVDRSDRQLRADLRTAAERFVAHLQCLRG